MEDLTSVGEPLTLAIGATKRGDRQQLAALLAAHPALAHARSLDGRSLLGHLTDYPANIANGPALVQALVAAGAAVDDLALNTAQGETPLQWAVSANDAAVATALLAAGAAVDGPQGKWPPALAGALLQAACGRGAPRPARRQAHAGVCGRAGARGLGRTVLRCEGPAAATGGASRPAGEPVRGRVRAGSARRALGASAGLRHD